MTIIAATSWDGQAWIACDTAGTDSRHRQGSYGVKMYEAPFGAFGFAGSYRAGQLARTALSKAERKLHTDDELDAVVALLEEKFKEAGWSKSQAEHLPRCSDLSLLLVTRRGGIFEIQSDFSWLRCKPYSAIGSGYQVALGALCYGKAMGHDPGATLRAAMNATAALTSSCGKPIYLWSVDGPRAKP